VIDEKYRLKRPNDLGINDMSKSSTNRNPVEYPKILRNLEEYEKLLYDEQKRAENLKNSEREYNI